MNQQPARTPPGKTPPGSLSGSPPVVPPGGPPGGPPVSPPRVVASTLGRRSREDPREIYIAPVDKAQEKLPKTTVSEILAARKSAGAHTPKAISPLLRGAFANAAPLQDAEIQVGESCLQQNYSSVITAYNKSSDQEEGLIIQDENQSVEIPTPASQDDAEIIMQSDAAIQFVKYSVNLLEKALKTDHVLNIQKQLRALNVEDSNVTSSFELSRVTFECGKYTAHRPVVGIACDPESTSIYVAYGSSSQSASKSLILKWSLDSENKPEDIYLCEVAEITCLTVLPGGILFAGTSGGNLVMWQTNTTTPSGGGGRPVQFVSSCMKGVVALFGYGDGQLISLDEEFGAIIWAVGASVVEGQKYNLRGKHSKSHGSEFLIAVASEDDKNFIACGNDGHLWKAILKTGSDLASVTDLRDSSELGSAVPNLITTHLALQKPGAQSPSPLFIASSMYWTMTLWQIVRSNESTTSEPKPLFCFEHQKATSYTTHVDWSPTHSHVFVNCTRDGWLALWDLNKSWAIPILSVDLKEELVRVAFSSDGKRIIVGHSSGKVTVGAVPVISTTSSDLPFFENMLKKYQ